MVSDLQAHSGLRRDHLQCACWSPFSSWVDLELQSCCTVHIVLTAVKDWPADSHCFLPHPVPWRTADYLFLPNEFNESEDRLRLPTCIVHDLWLPPLPDLCWQSEIEDMSVCEAKHGNVTGNKELWAKKLMCSRTKVQGSTRKAEHHWNLHGNLKGLIH